ncbi:MAG: hypothetical protein ACTTKF_06245 [Bacteroides sp.]|jgi:hypothetical protein
MRYFQIVMEILWVVLALLCLYLGITRWHVPGHFSLIFFIMAGVALLMAFFRNYTRRKRERRPRRS